MSNPLSSIEELISTLLAKAGPVERREYLNEQTAQVSVEVVAALKVRADEQEQEDPQAVLHISQVAGEIADRLADDTARAIAAVIRANTFRRLGQHREAMACYEQAARFYESAGDSTAGVLSQIGKVNALTQLGRYDEALEIAARIQSVLNTNGDDLARAKLDMNLGVLRARLNQIEAALSHYEAARVTFSALGDVTRVAMLDANRANLLTDLDDFRGAEALYQAAREAFSASGLTSAAAQVDQSIAYLLFAQGQFDSALRLFEQAREIFSQSNQPIAVADIELDKGEVYLRLNLLDEAWAACDRAEAVLRQQGYALELGRLVMNRALVHLERRNLQESVPLLAEAARIFEDEGNEVWKSLAQLNQAIYSLRAARPSEALPLARQAALVFDRQGLRTRHCLALTLVGDAYQALGDWGQTETSYRSALAAIQDLDAPWLSYRCYHGLGRVYQQVGAQEDAYREYRRAVGDLERVHSSFGIEPHRIAFLQDKLEPYEDLILFCLAEQATERVEEAFEYVERAKSRALVDLLARNLSGRVQPHDEVGKKLVSDLERLREELNWYYNRLHDHNPDASQRSPAVVAKAWREINRLEQQANGLMHQMRVRYTDYLSLRQVQLASLQAVRACLPPDGLLIEYYIACDAALAFTLSEDGLQVYRDLMNPAQIEQWLEAFRFQINKFRYGKTYAQCHHDTLRAGADRSLKALYEGLLAPLADELREGRPLVIIPHGLLHYIPFLALYNGERYLVQDHLVYSAPSAGVLKLCCERNPGSDGPALLLGVADPSIPHVIEEVNEIGHLLGQAALYTGTEATLDRLQTDGPGRALVHIASHGLFRADNPLFSALRLADGWLNVNDIYDLKLNARLVTLSGCETGMGSVARGDELIGLSRAFFYAGASSLVVSLWAVSDESTAVLMRQFYESLRSGYSVADSLRRAQLSLMDDFPHPYYWASFNVTGDGQVTLGNSTPSLSQI